MGLGGRSQESTPPRGPLALGLADEGVATAFTPVEGGRQIPSLSRMPTDPAGQGLDKHVKVLDSAQTCLQPAK